MEKVKVTREQAEAIESALKFYNEDHLIDKHCTIQKNRDLWVGSFEELNDIEVWKLARAVYIGYEVEPEFKVGDWVKYKYLDGTTIYGQVDTKAFDDIIGNFSNGIRHRYHKSKVEYMIPEEIKQEKERRWWRSHGREVWELHESDLLLEPNGVISKVNYISVTGDVWLNRGMESIEFIKDFCKVVVFSENRLDVNTNE